MGVLVARYLNENFAMIVYKFPKRYYTCIDYFLNSLKQKYAGIRCNREAAGGLQ